MAQGIVKCELCVKDEDGIWFCKNCHQSLCEGCKTSHLRANISKHHEIISRSDMFQTQGETARHVDEYCKTHSKELYILFCRKCQCLVCRMCLTDKHAGHSVVAIEKVFREQRERGEKYIKELSQRDALSNTELYEALEREIKAEASKVKAEVDAATETMLEEAKHHCQTVEKSNEKTETALHKLNKSLQGNRVSEIMEAVQFCASMETAPDSATKLNQMWKFKFVPGTHSVEETSKLLGHVEISSYSKEKPTGFVLSYAELDVDTMCLRYNFPAEERKRHIKPVAQLRGPNPFSEKLKQFSIKIKNEGESKLIGIGMAPKGYSKLNFPGWGSNSYGYHADDGGIFTESGYSCEETEECYEGDTMTCHFEVTTGKLSFFRNDFEVFTKKVPNKIQYFPLVAMETPGEEVLLLERDPWFL